MTLDAYLKRKGAINLTTLSDKIGISKGRLSQLRKSKDWPPELALKVEAATGGVMNASKLSVIVAMARSTKTEERAA
ncbi:hypothetical protein [Sphingobium sp. CFD-1]|uniref:hypothetical protein n=1 Tax=Sphingobium sp. CFD-1 TaxID=2878545 RepID=UPI00214BE486|nr:hypothetical protein [Sphingobium sp. CFD-1]